MKPENKKRLSILEILIVIGVIALSLMIFVYLNRQMGEQMKSMRSFCKSKGNGTFVYPQSNSTINCTYWNKGIIGIV